MTQKYGEVGLARRHDRPAVHRQRRPEFRRVRDARHFACGFEGDANDYVGKGLSGGKIVIAPPPEATFRRKRTSSSAMWPSMERRPARPISAAWPASALPFATAGQDRRRRHRRPWLRVHDRRRCGHPRPAGRNFAAGMSGGFAYVYDPDGKFRENATLKWSTCSGRGLQGHRHAEQPDQPPRALYRLAGRRRDRQRLCLRPAALRQSLPARLSTRAGTKQSDSTAMGTDQWLTARWPFHKSP